MTVIAIPEFYAFRVLKYHVDTGNFANKSCYIAIFEELPSSVYVNVDELADLRRVQKVCYIQKHIIFSINIKFDLSF